MYTTFKIITSATGPCAPDLRSSPRLHDPVHQIQGHGVQVSNRIGAGFALAAKFQGNIAAKGHYNDEKHFAACVHLLQIARKDALPIITINIIIFLSTLQAVQLCTPPSNQPSIML